MKREYTVLTALGDAFPYCPRTVAFCGDEAILGAPFYLMERLRGIVIRRALPPGLGLDADRFRRLCERLVDVLVELHSLDYREVGLGDFGRPEGYVERQVLGWAKRYRRARTPDVPDFEEVMAWLEQKMPTASQRACIIHNDYKLDNVVLDPEDPIRIVGVLDWEMATIGDPLMDLGEVLSYWIQRDDPPGLQVLRMVASHLDGAPTRSEIAERYAAGTGLDLSGLDFYYAFGLFRIAVITQQIYYRYYYGQSHDLRFGMFGHSVLALEKVCREIIQRSEL
jgi:aminoglycoside phosphotransferase (APT) family kinase protein